MPVYDNDGTASCEIGKLYDNDGTTNYQIGKVYDNDGTTNRLIYSAAETIVYDTWDTAIWTTFAEGTKGNTGSIAFYTSQLQVNIIPTGQWCGYTAGARTIEKVDLTGYKSISVSMGGTSWPSSDGFNRANIFVRSTTSGENVASAYLTPNGSFQTLTLDVSALSGSYYVFICGSVYNGSASSAQYNFRAAAPITFTAD